MNKATERAVRWNREHPEKHYAHQMAWRRRNPEWVRGKNHRHNRRLKIEVLTHYSNPVPVCACCGVRYIEFLAIDHIGGGGAIQRKNANGKLNGSKLYRWLRATGYPSGYRVLCHNCNMAIGLFGACPHSEVAIQ